MPKIQPLYARIRKTLEREITSGKRQIGEQLPGEPDLCKAYGVSRVTLRHSLAELCTEGFLEKINGKGTFITANQPKKNFKKTLKIVIPDNSFFRQMLLPAEEIAHKRGYGVLFANIDNADLETHIKLGAENGAAGYVLTPVLLGSLKSPKNKKIVTALSKLRTRKIPFVLIGEILKNYAFDSVGTHNYLGGFLATKHLLEHGFKKIAYLSSSTNQENHLRLAGYRDALAKHQIQPMVKEIMTWEGNYGYRETKNLLLKDRPDAIFVFDDLAAVQVLWAARDLAIKVPEKLGVIGFDDHSFVAPPITLTSINQNLPQIANLAIELLIRRMEGDWSDFPSKVQVKPVLVTRQSCGCVAVKTRDSILSEERLSSLGVTKQLAFSN